MRITDLALRLLGATSGEQIIKAASAASGAITLPSGTVDFSATGGASQVVKQTTAGGPFTVAQLTAADIGGGVAPLNSPAFTGNPTAPTPTAGDNDTSIATTAFVATSFAPLVSPGLAGVPTAPTPAAADNSTTIATTAFVKSQNYLTGNQTITLSGDISGSGTAAITTTLPNVNANVGTFQGLTVNAKGQVTAAINQNYAPLASPTFTGTPAAPTPLTADNSTTLATTAFVKAQSYLTASGLSGMTAGQVPIAATATTVTSSTPTGTTGNSTIVQTTAAGTLAAAVMPAHTGDVTSPAGSTVNTLPTVNSNVGTFQGLTVNAKGQVTAAVNQGYGVGTLTGVTAGTGLAGGGTSGNPTMSLTTPVAVANGGTGATAFTINSGSNVGLGASMLVGAGTAAVTADPYWGTWPADGGLVGAANSATVNPYIEFSRALGTVGSPAALALNTNLGVIQWDGYATAWAFNRAQIAAKATEAWTGSAQGTRLDFEATPTGTTAPAVKMTLNNGLQIGAPTGGDKGAGTLNATAVYANGTALTSDERLKRDIAPLPDDCLRLVAAIEPKRFKFVEPPEPAGPPGWFDKTRWGFVAQDVAAAMPDAVEVDAEGNQYVSPSDLTACLWRGVQELTARVKTLEAALDAKSA
jgi:hypothetical protein